MHLIPSLESGGAERMLSKIIETDNKNEHTIIYFKKGSVVYNFDKAKVYYCNLKSIKSILSIVTKIVYQNSDVINTWMKANILGVIIKFLTRKTKIIFNIRHDFPDEINVKYFIEKLIVYFSRFADGTIFVSYSAYKNYILKGYHNRNTIVINNGFNVGSSNNYKLENEEKIIIGYVGRKNYIKNQKRLLKIYNEAEKMNPNLELWLIGRELDELPINEYLEDSSNVKIYGEMNDLDAIYKSINILMLTSLKEGFPNVIGEAMSYGVPIVTTDAGDSFNIIGKYGIRINRSDTDKQVANKIWDLLTNQEKVSEESQYNHKRIKQHYDIVKITQQYYDFYNFIKGE